MLDFYILKRRPGPSKYNARDNDSTDEVTQAARTRATALVDSFVSIPATEGDLRCIEERQLRHKAGTTAGVSPPCRHGFPQAFGFDPCGYKTSSGLFRLSCPLLVQAIDSLEDEGGIEHMNARLDVEEDLREVSSIGVGGEPEGGGVHVASGGGGGIG